MTGVLRAIGTTVAAGAALGVAGLAWGVTETHLFTLRRATAPVLPLGAEPVTVLHISDIHLVPSQRDKLEWVASLAELEPDLVINTGDNITSPEAVALVLDALDGLLDVPGAFVWGSNDYKAPHFKNPLGYLAGNSSTGRKPETPELPWPRLRDAFTSRAWVDLTHQRQRLQVGDLEVELRGTDDAHLHRDDYAQVAGPASEGVDLSIGVTHAPYLRVLDAMAADGLDLIMAGHTHGGQVCLPHRALVTNCDIEPERVKGLHQHTAGGHTSWLHVSAGLGTSPFAPYRVFCRPEATLLTLVPRDA